VTILKTEKGVLRFVNMNTGRTVAEYQFSLSGERLKEKIPNKVLVGGKFYETTESAVTIVTTGSQGYTFSWQVGTSKSGDWGIVIARKDITSTAKYYPYTTNGKPMEVIAV
jgi:hypothetical protein